MWCSTCHQDVPGVAHAASGRIVCSRCQQPMRSKKPAHAARICDEGIELDEPPAAAVAAAPRRFAPTTGPPGSARAARPRAATADTAASQRRPAPFRAITGGSIRRKICSANSSTTIARRRRTHRRRSQPRTQSRAHRSEPDRRLAHRAVRHRSRWPAASASSPGRYPTQQMLYWNLALGLTLGGQGTLILGLVLVVSRLWRNSRYAAGKLQEVHARLGQLQHTADASPPCVRRRAGVLCRPRPRREPASAARESQGPARPAGDAAGQRVGQLAGCSTTLLSLRPASRFLRPRPRSSRAIARASRGRGS